MARRISILLFAFAFFATWLLLDSSSYNQLPSGSTSLPNPEALPEHSPRPPSSNPFHPTSCDPAAYTKDSIEHYLLTAPDDSNAPPWAGVNHEQFRSLCECLLTNSCLENQDKVVVLNVNHFGTWYRNSIHALNGGETVWGISIIESLRRLHYTFFYADNFDEVQEMYRLFTTSVPAIIMSDEHIFDCWEDQAHCVKSPQNPLGPPIWKIFTFHFWPTAAHPLGHPWTISPEDYASQIMKATDENTYIPYSVEPSCDLQPLIPPTKRDQGRVWTLAKRLSYLTPHYERAWPASYLASVSRNTGAHFMLGAENDTEFTTEHIPSIDELGGERVVQNLGLLDRPQFMEEMAKSMVLLGVGRPAISPTPYQALCLGVPFINPIMDWDIDDPEERKGWWTQHDGLKFLDPPFVYNVRKDDESGLTKAITLAMQNPIPRYIPPGRSLPEAAVHMDAFLRRDWRSEAEALLAERIRTKQGERFTL